MYVPAHFSADDDSVHELLSRNQAADLVTAGPDGLDATMMPFLYDRERATLQGHFARNSAAGTPGWHRQGSRGTERR